jgi:hypothetical protein
MRPGAPGCSDLRAKQFVFDASALAYRAYRPVEALEPPTRHAPMSTRRWHHSNRAARWFVCCCLALALPLGGLSALLAGALGAVHFHQPAAVAALESGPMAGWQDFRRLNHVADSGVHLHDHAKLGRHHHDANDAGLVTVGAGEHDEGVDGAATAAAISIVLAASVTVSLDLPAPSATGVPWAAAAACRFESCALRRLERPPIG